MARRRTSKPTRGERRAQRARSERARQHGLPAREIPKPVRARDSMTAAASNGSRKIPDDERDGDAPAPSRRQRPWTQRVVARARRLPPAAWLALAAAVLLILVSIVGRSGTAPAGPATTSAPPRATVAPELPRMDALPLVSQTPPSLSGFIPPPEIRESPLPGPVDPALAPVGPTPSSVRVSPPPPGGSAARPPATPRVRRAPPAAQQDNPY